MAAKVQLWVGTPREVVLDEEGAPIELPLKTQDIDTLSEGFDIIARAGEGVLNIEVEDIPGDNHDLLYSFSIELKRTARGTWWDAQRDF